MRARGRRGPAARRDARRVASPARRVDPRPQRAHRGRPDRRWRDFGAQRAGAFRALGHHRAADRHGHGRVRRAPAGCSRDLGRDVPDFLASPRPHQRRPRARRALRRARPAAPCAHVGRARPPARAPAHRARSLRRDRLPAGRRGRVHGQALQLRRLLPCTARLRAGRRPSRGALAVDSAPGQAHRAPVRGDAPLPPRHRLGYVARRVGPRHLRDRGLRRRLPGPGEPARIAPRVADDDRGVAAVGRRHAHAGRALRGEGSLFR